MDVEEGAAREENQARFETDLEFVQALGNPYYLSQLAYQGTLEDAALLNYIKYLHSYFLDPAYARFVQYPQSLHILTLLQEPSFRAALKNESTAGEVSRRMIAHWAHWRNHNMTVKPENAEVPAGPT